MWHDHQFSQRNKTIKRAVGVEVGGYLEEEGWGGQKLKKGVGNKGVKGGLQKIGGFRNPLPLINCSYCWIWIQYCGNSLLLLQLQISDDL